MTGLLAEREFSRQSLLKGGGALIVSISVLGTGIGAKAAPAAAQDPFGSNGPLDPQQLDSWLAVHADNTVSIKLGKVELGNGSMTGHAMIAAEELDIEVSQVRVITADTDLTPNQGASFSSNSMSLGGRQTRAAAAASRQALLGLAATQLGVPAASLTVSSGVVSGEGKSVTYGQLIGDRVFQLAIPASYGLAPAPSGQAGAGLAPGAPGTKPVSDYALVGIKSPPRIDIPAKVTGTYTYVHSVRVPGMLHGRVVRPRGQGAFGPGTAPPIESVDTGSIRNVPGVRVLQKGNFLGVVAPREYDAIRAAAQLKVAWGAMPPLGGVGNLFAQMRSQDAAGQVPTVPYFELGDVDTALPGATRVVSGTY
ncbi:MAG TPA: molybdopterin cofactor-binding domain-containing protein, partial [Solirubrobacteraceae bacterium]|nr:molybdopterin cofactor-binding domain-containing protein [Solirubrobacteraceae bacterium]